VSAGTVTRTESRTSEIQTDSWFNSSTLHTLTNMWQPLRVTQWEIHLKEWRLVG